MEVLQRKNHDTKKMNEEIEKWFDIFLYDEQKNYYNGKCLIYIYFKLYLLYIHKILLIWFRHCYFFYNGKENKGKWWNITLGRGISYQRFKHKSFKKVICKRLFVIFVIISINSITNI